MKKIISKFLVLLLIFISVSCVFTVPASADQAIIFDKLYMKDGITYMPVMYNGGSDGTFSATLTDSNNKVITTFKTMRVVNKTKITYNMAFSKVKSGTYYLNIKFVYNPYYGKQNPISSRLKITYKQPTPTVMFSKTYQKYTDTGDVNQIFVFGYAGTIGKKINFEIYDEDGNPVLKKGVTLNSYSGGYTLKWDYYPTKGLRVSNGTYIMKYWVDGQTPKQVEFEVNLSEG